MNLVNQILAAALCVLTTILCLIMLAADLTFLGSHAMTTETTAKYRAYTEAFRDGMRDACDGVKRAQAFAISQEVPVRQGDAYLAGYYAELRRLRNYQDLER